MIFIATGANASASNLGKISIKSVGDIQADTVTRLNFFGKTWTDDQKISIDDFLVAFNAASWKSKVKVMYIPILIPAQNKVVNATITATGSKFRKNMADFNAELTASAPFAGEPNGYIGVSNNGLVIQNNDAGGNPTANISLGLATTSFGITNKAVHYGVYYKTSSLFRAGSASSAEGIIQALSSTESANFFNNISIPNTSITGAKSKLVILNGDVNIATSKSYFNKALVASTIINTQASAAHTNAAVITGYPSNTVNDSTSCFMTFGNYMTDSELLEYGNLIETLMASLIV